MNSYIRMKEDVATPDALMAAATALFVTRGYAGTSIRAITELAGANLGAVTYHYGSKDALYLAVATSLLEPFREHVAITAQAPGAPLDRLESLVRAVFEYLHEHPDLPRFIVQQLAGVRPVPTPVRHALEANHRVIAELIAAGQRDGSIRDGDPRLLALSVVAQPIWMTVVREFLQQTVGVNQDDPETRADVIDTAMRFVRAGLAGQRGSTS